MSWERALVGLLDDLEQQASGLHLAERDAEVAEMSVAEYARVRLTARLHASLGRTVRVRLLGGRQLAGRLARVGEDWLLLVDPSGGEWIVRNAGVAAFGGLSARADSDETWSVVDRLSLRSVLRGLREDRSRCQVHLVDDHQLVGRIDRVGADFVELRQGEGAEQTLQVVPVEAVAALQGQP